MPSKFIRILFRKGFRAFEKNDLPDVFFSYREREYLGVVMIKGAPCILVRCSEKRRIACVQALEHQMQ